MRSFPIEYTVVADSPNTRQVTTISRVLYPDPLGQRFSIPTWIAGSYLIREFAKHVMGVNASCGQKPVRIRKLTKNQWQCDPCEGPLEITLDIYCWDTSIRGASFDQTHLFFNSNCILPKIHGHEDSAIRLSITGKGIDPTWTVATALSLRDGLSFQASSYAELIDHPVLMGTLKTVDFSAAGTPHQVAIYGQSDVNLERLAQDLTTLCTVHIDFFGRPAPFSRYVFLIRVTDDGYGGLEHQASSVLLCRRKTLPSRHCTSITPDYEEFLGLCSHEYFHAWNVKRIRPKAFSPINSDQESYTQQLWIFEGITSYYDDLMLLRSGLISAERYLALLGKQITRVYRTPGRHHQSLAESSFDTWIKFYRPDDNTPNACVSYYTKGSLAALALDLHLRAHKRSLDEVMLALWQEFGLTNRPLEEGEFERVAQQVTGMDLSDFFEQAIRGIHDMSLSDFFKRMGLECIFRAADGNDDTGGRPALAPDAELMKRPFLGVNFGQTEAGLSTFSHVLEGGSAHAAGIAPGDVLVAMDGLRVDKQTIDGCLSRYQVGETVELHVFRNGTLQLHHMRLLASPLNTCYLRPSRDITDAQQQQLKDWLKQEPFFKKENM